MVGVSDYKRDCSGTDCESVKIISSNCFCMTGLTKLFHEIGSVAALQRTWSDGCAHVAARAPGSKRGHIRSKKSKKNLKVRAKPAKTLSPYPTPSPSPRPVAELTQSSRLSREEKKLHHPPENRRYSWPALEDFLLFCGFLVIPWPFLGSGGVLK